MTTLQRSPTTIVDRQCVTPRLVGNDKTGSRATRSSRAANGFLQLQKAAKARALVLSAPMPRRSIRRSRQ